MIFHHFADNPNLLYAIITSHRTFQELGTFSLARGLREIRRVELAKEEQARQAEHERRLNSKQDIDVEAGDPQAEKARLLQNESEAATARSVVEPSRESTPEVDNGLNVDLSSRFTTSDNSPPPNRFEKTRGKMRERTSESLDIGGMERFTVGVGRNGFVPTQEWVRRNNCFDEIS